MIQDLKHPIILRPHHGLCLQHFEGSGYSKEFVENMTLVLKHLTEHPSQTVQLQCTTDILCSRCPHNLHSRCKSGQKVASYDAACLALCGLREGDILSWKQFRQLIQLHILQKQKLSGVCINCEWLAICGKKT